ATAADSSFGRWVASRASPPGRPLGWAVRTGGLGAIARRLDLTVHRGARVAPSGEVLRWRSAGIDQAVAEPALPFFIEWAAGLRLPGATALPHPRAPPPPRPSSRHLQAPPGRRSRPPGRLARQPPAPDRRAHRSPRRHGHRP